jgi:hypothetical protein
LSADSVHFFACLKKRTKEKTPRVKNTAILLSHFQTALIAMQNIVFTQRVDNPPPNKFYKNFATLPLAT